MADGSTLDSLKADLEQLKLEANKQAISFTAAQEYQKLSAELQATKNEINEIKNDLTLKWGYLRVGGFVLSVILTIAGGIGIRSLNDISNQVHQTINSDVETQRKFYADLMAGTALTIQGNFNAAVPRLKKCFDEKHTYDKSVLIPLLQAINLTDDWTNGESIIRKLRSDPQKFEEINDATVYRVVAAIEIQSGLSLRSRGQQAEGNARMDQGFALLTQALAITQPNDYDTRVHILNNAWIYHIANGEFNKAREDVEAIDRLPPKIQVYGWPEIQTWRCFKDYATLNEKAVAKNLQVAAEEWKMLEKRYRQ